MTSKKTKKGSNSLEASHLSYQTQISSCYRALRTDRDASSFLVALNGLANWKTLNMSKDDAIELGANALSEQRVDVCDVVFVLNELKVNYRMTFGFDAFLLMLETLSARNSLQSCQLPLDLAALGSLMESLLDPTTMIAAVPQQLPPPASVTEIKVHRKKLRFFCKSIDRIYALFPYIRLAPISSASVFRYMETLVTFEQFTGLPIMYALFRRQLEPSSHSTPLSTLSALLLQLEERGEHEVCYALIKQEWNEKKHPSWKPSNSTVVDALTFKRQFECFTEVVRDFISGAMDRCSSFNRCFRSLVLDTISLLGFHDMRDSTKYRLACMQVTQNVQKGKWQFCISSCYSPALQAHLYVELRAQMLFKEALQIYDSCGLSDLNSSFLPAIVPVTSEELAAQEERLALEFMRIPLLAESIIVVDSMSTLYMASCALGLEEELKLLDRLTEADNWDLEAARLVERICQLGPYRGPVGLDSEWDAALQGPSTRSGTGAEILQIACLHFVLLFDLRALGHRMREAQAADELLSTLMVSPTRLKIGFRFDKSDVHMLLMAGGGKFVNAFNKFKSMVDIASIVQMLSNADSRASVKQTEGISPASAHFKTLATLKKGSQSSLSDLCFVFLGKKLNKSQQMSSWSVRPLTAEQQEYAALDAHCLLALLDIVTQLVSYRGESFKIGIVSAYPAYGDVLALTKELAQHVTNARADYSAGIYDSVCERIERMALDNNGNFEEQVEKDVFPIFSV